MANIDIGALYRRQSDIKSPVDSSIVLNKNESDTVVYSDLKLDLELKQFFDAALNAQASNNDLLLLTNEESVINAFKNILNTTYHTRILNPELDMDLRAYLFEPLTEAKAFFLGYDIMHKIARYEPRISVDSIVVSALIASDCYTIDMTVSVPDLGNKKVSLSSVLSSDGFSFR